MRNYILPKGNVQICFSGGRTSAYLLHCILEANNGLPDRARVIFTNTGREMDQTLDFVNECAHKWGVSVTWLEYDRKDRKPGFIEIDYNRASRDGLPFSKLITSKSYLPNVVTRFCTIELKIRTAKRYLLTQGWGHWTNALGIRFDEARRVKVKQPKERWSNWYPLFNAGITKHDIVDFWAAQSFDLKLENVKGKTPLGNCDGCFLKSEKTLAGLCREYPKRFSWWIEQEYKVNSTFHKNRSYSELQSFVEKQRDWIFEDETFLCQASDGECII